MIINKNFILKISLLLCANHLGAYLAPINSSSNCQQFINQLQQVCPELSAQIQTQSDLMTMAMLLEHSDQEPALFKKCNIASHVTQCLNPQELADSKELSSIRYLQQSQALAVWAMAKNKLAQS